MRADELEPFDRIRHPDTGEIVEVTRVSVGLSNCTVYFKINGFQGRIRTHPHKELEDCS